MQSEMAQEKKKKLKNTLGDGARSEWRLLGMLEHLGNMPLCALRGFA